MSPVSTLTPLRLSHRYRRPLNPIAPQLPVLSRLLREGIGASAMRVRCDLRRDHFSSVDEVYRSRTWTPEHEEMYLQRETLLLGYVHPIWEKMFTTGDLSWDWMGTYQLGELVECFRARQGMEEMEELLLIVMDALVHDWELDLGI